MALSSSSGEDATMMEDTEPILQWLSSRKASGSSLVKISEAKEIFPSITLVIIERIFEHLVSTDYLVLEGKSRVKLFAITDKITSHCVDNVDAPASSVKEINVT